MKKAEAISLFGSRKAFQEALQLPIRTYYNWKDDLTLAQTDRVIGAYVRITEEMDRRIVHSFRGAN
jgi:hypothetical protein